MRSARGYNGTAQPQGRGTGVCDSGVCDTPLRTTAYRSRLSITSFNLYRSPADRRDYLNKKSITYADKMMKRWDKLAKYLIVRYNDQVVRKVDKDGNFQRWGYDTPGYDIQFINSIGTATGDRYKLKEVIERRER